MSQSQPTLAGTSPQTWAIVVWGLFLASLFSFALTGVVGVIIAYVKRGDLVGTPYESHMTSAIRTFWIVLIGAVIGFLLTFVLIGFLLLVLLGLWHIF